MSSESRRTHRRMIEPALSPTQSVAPPIPRRGMTRRAFCAGAAFLAAAGRCPLPVAAACPSRVPRPFVWWSRCPARATMSSSTTPSARWRWSSRAWPTSSSAPTRAPSTSRSSSSSRTSMTRPSRGRSIRTSHRTCFTATTSTSPPTFAPGASCRWTMSPLRLSATTSSTICGTWAWWRAARI